MSRNVFSGSYSVGVPPLPIPNRAVKPARADGTAYKRESRSLPLFLSSQCPVRQISRAGHCFFCVYGVRQGLAAGGAGECAVGNGVWRCGRLCLAGRWEGKVEGGLLEGAGLRYVSVRGVEDVFAGGMDEGAGLRYVALRCVEDIFSGGMDGGAGLRCVALRGVEEFCRFRIRIASR